jgi:hypothetical protein
VSDGGMVHLRGLIKLQHLDLRNTQVSDAGLQSLKGLARLQQLDLWGTTVTGAGVANLKEALPSCQIVHDRW